MDRHITIRLPDELLGQLDRLAAETGYGRSALVRRALYAYVVGGEVECNESPLQRVRDLIGAAHGGPPDLGRRHREYLKTLFRRGFEIRP